MKRKTGPHHPSPEELRTRGELDRARRELQKLKRPKAEEENAAASDPAAEDESGTEVESLREQIAELTVAKQRLSRLYFNQLEENRKRSQKLRQILESVRQINSDLDLDVVLRHFAETVRTTLGFN